MRGIKKLLTTITSFFFGLLIVVFLLFIGSDLKTNNQINDKLNEIYNNVGTYDEQKIVLHDTNLTKSKKLASRFNAQLRMSDDEQFATLTLPKGITVKDVFENKINHDVINELSIDYYFQPSEIEEDTLKLPIIPSSYVPSDEFYPEQTYLNYLNLTNVWENYQGLSTTVAIIDTGIDIDHPEFNGRVSEHSYNASTDKVVSHYMNGDDYDWSIIADEDGHGTGVAGIIGAEMNNGGITGIAPRVNLLVIKCELNSDGNLSSSDLLFGIYYAIARYVDVINMSFSGSHNVFAEALQMAVDNDIFCVASAGNKGSMNLHYPAADPNVIAVGALEENSWELADYSNFGDNVDLVAPGTAFTTDINQGYKKVSGTSISAPIISGALALIYQSVKYLEFNELLEILYGACFDLGIPGKDLYYGFGSLDFTALLREYRGIINFDIQADELDNIKQIFIMNKPLQYYPEPIRNYSVFAGWFYDIECTEEVNYFEDLFTYNITLYAKWENEDDSVPYTYNVLSDNSIEITGYTGKRKYITIPEYIDDKVVSSIGYGAFANRIDLITINLPNQLETISNRAFINCNRLTNIVIPSSVKVIGDEAFNNNVRLRNIEIMENSQLKEIGGLAFAHTGIAKFDIPASVTTLDGSSFYSATNLTEINVLAGNKNYRSREGVLYNISLTELVAYPNNYQNEFSLLDSVTTIGNYAFANSSFKQIDLKNVNKIGDSAFYQSSLVSIDLENIQTLGQMAFSYSSLLADVNIGSSLVNINTFAFTGCSLTNITIPKNIIRISRAAFSNNFELEQLIFEEGSNCLSIDDFAFANNNLTTLDIPTSVTSLGSYAFYANYFLEEVNFSENSNLQYLNSWAFGLTLSLEEINLPQNLKSIGSYAFANSGLLEITIPSKVTDIEEGAFAEANQLENIFVVAGNIDYIDIDGVLYTSDRTILLDYPKGRTQSVFEVVSSTVYIGDSAFEGSLHLTNIILPEGIEEIGIKAFANSVSLTNITLPNSLKIIEEHAFSNSINLGPSLEIPNGVIQIGRFAFSNTVNLKTITFEENSSLKRISDYAFAFSSIESIVIPSSVNSFGFSAFLEAKQLKHVTFDYNSELYSIGANLFEGCNNIQKIKFLEGSQLEVVLAYAFANLRALQSVDFGNAPVEVIGNFAFKDCSTLYDITLPKTVKSIGRFAFYGCGILSEINIPESVEFIGRHAFDKTSNINLYFVSENLPATLQENWDYGIQGYYIGVLSVGESGDFKYAVLKNNNISIIDYYGNDLEVDLSALNLEGNITQIGGFAFYEKNLESIVLPDTLEIISNNAFENSQLASIVIPSKVTFIGKYAFNNTLISTLMFEENSELEKIEQYAFSNTNSLEYLKIPSSVQIMEKAVFMNSGILELDLSEATFQEIPEMAFYGTKITEVIIPDSVIAIRDNAFRNALLLEEVTFGEVESLQIFRYAFYNTSLTSLHLPSNITDIGEYAFVGLTKLFEFSVDIDNPKFQAIDGILFNKTGKKIIAVPGAKTGTYIMPNTVEVIGFGAFENSNFTKVEFEENINLLTIGFRAFYNSKLQEITIPKSVISIDYYAFAMSKDLTTVNFEKDNKLTGIYEGAFYGCQSLENIILPQSIVEIADFAFYGTNKLKELPFSIKHEINLISNYAFAYSGIKNLELPSSVIEIGEYAFRGTKINKVVISDKNKYDLIIGLGAFSDCNNLQEMTVPFIGQYFNDDYITWLGYFFGAGSYQSNYHYTPSSLKKVTITEGLPAIKTGAFYGLRDLEEIEIPHSVTEVHHRAFGSTTAKYELTNKITVYKVSRFMNMGQRRLYKVLYPDFSFSTFGDGIYGKLHLEGDFSKIFDQCDVRFSNLMLEEIILPEGITRISNFNLGGFTNEPYRSPFKYIYIPDSVEEIGVLTVNSLGNLKEFPFGPNLVDIGHIMIYFCHSIEEIILPSTVTLTEITSQAFNNNHGLRKIVLPDSIVSIGRSAFSSCESLQTIEIPNSVTEIGMFAFSNCDSLVNIVLPDSLELLEQYAFLNCYSLESIVLPEGLRYINASTFENCTSLKEVTLPSTLLGISNNAFYNCESLQIINNNSNLELNFGSLDYGQIAKNATRIVLQDGTILDNNYVEEEYDYININDFIFEEDNNVYYLIGYVGSESEVTLPLHYDGHSYKIKHFNSENVKKIIIPNGFQLVDDEAFYNNAYVEEIVLPPSILTIRQSAFEKCINLKNIELPQNLTKIDSFAFRGCTSLISIDIPDSVTSFGDYMFAGSRNLEIVILPNHMERLPTYFFSGCYALKSIVLPTNLKTIEAYAFNRCLNLEEVILPEGLITISSGAFADCPKLKNLYLSANVKNISTSSFNLIESLTIDPNNKNFTFDEGVLYNLRKTEIYFISRIVKSITIPKTITNTDYLLQDNQFIEEVYFEDGTTITEIGKFAFYGCRNLRKVVLPPSIEKISSHAFYLCDKLEEINLSEGLRYIESGAFTSTKSLKCIEIPSTVTVIKDRAFDLSGVVEVIINEGVTTIGSRAFSYCYDLVKINIPNSVTNIGESIFISSDQLETIELDLNEDFFTIIDGVVYNKNITKIIFALPNLEGNLIIPNTITEIGEFTFANQLYLDSVYIPDSVTTIGQGAFTGSRISSLRLPAIAEIDMIAYRTDIETLIIPEGVITINGSAFSNSLKLYKVVLPSTLEEINVSAFSYCPNLYEIINNSNINLQFGSKEHGEIAYYATKIVNKDGSITYRDEGITYHITNDDFLFKYVEVEATYYLKAYLGNLDIVTLPSSFNGSTYVINQFHGAREVIVPEGFLKISNEAFNDRKLEKVTLPESVIEIGIGAFYECINLSEINIPSGLKKINYSAFRETNLSSIILPEGLEVIEDYAFNNIKNLTSINMPSSLIKVGSNILYDTGIYNDESNWSNDGLYINNYLLAVRDNLEYFSLNEGTTFIAYRVFEYNKTIKSFEIDLTLIDDLIFFTNLETLIIQKAPTENWQLHTYYGYNLEFPPTLKEIIFTKDVEIYSSYVLYGLENIDVYLEASKSDVMWDVFYPNWHNDNRVYYGDKWITARFYLNGELILINYPSRSEIVRQPYIENYYENNIFYEFIGWDLDKDGIVDFIPATSIVDINADAVFEAHYLGQWEVLKEATCTEDGLKVKRCIDCGRIFEEEVISKNNHSELLYIKTVDPTYNSEGYDLYVCLLCGEEIRLNPTNKLAHTFSDWIIENESNCFVPGSKYRYCLECGEIETEIIQALEHNYLYEVIKDASCTEMGEIKYTCTICGNQFIQRIDPISHNYIKKPISPELFVIIQSLIDDVISIEEEGIIYYYECEMCQLILTNYLNSSFDPDEPSNHRLGHFELVYQINDEQAIFARKCQDCNEYIEVKISNSIVDSHIWDLGVITKEATCDAPGEILYTCLACGEQKTEPITQLNHVYTLPIFVWDEYQATVKVVCYHDESHEIILEVVIDIETIREASLGLGGIFMHRASTIYNGVEYTSSKIENTKPFYSYQIYDEDGYLIFQENLLEGTEVYLPEINIDEGYEITGWYLDSNHYLKWNEGTPLTQSIQLYYKVVDVLKPSLILNPGIDTVYVGDDWIDTGIIILDNSNEQINYYQNIYNISTSDPGRYIIIYSATDSAGNEATITRVVNVIEKEKTATTNLKPSIDTITEGDEWIDEGCEFVIDGITYVGDTKTVVDTSKPGVYIIKYEIVVGNTTYSQVRYVYVLTKDNKIPELTVPYFKRKEELLA